MIVAIGPGRVSSRVELLTAQDIEHAIAYALAEIPITTTRTLSHCATRVETVPVFAANSMHGKSVEPRGCLSPDAQPSRLFRKETRRKHVSLPKTFARAESSFAHPRIKTRRDRNQTGKDRDQNQKIEPDPKSADAVAEHEGAESVNLVGQRIETRDSL